MSYDITLGGHAENITLNLGKFFHTFIDTEQGIRALHGKTGKQGQIILAAAFSKFATYRDINDDAVLTCEFSAGNGWGTWEDAFRLLTRLNEVCIRHPRKIIHVF